MIHVLPQLPYPYDALEPFYDSATLEIHYSKHHATYVEKLNKALSTAPALADKTVEELLCDPGIIPSEIHNAVMQNGGGHANHSLFWRTLAKGKGGEPGGKIGQVIRSEFGNFQTFRKRFNDSATNLFGSGWTFLVQTSEGRLEIRNLPNQETPITQNQKPILLLDLWEHAYYLKWQNRRAEWIDTWWKIVDWEQVEYLYEEEPAWMHAHA